MPDDRPRQIFASKKRRRNTDTMLRVILLLATLAVLGVALFAFFTA